MNLYRLNLNLLPGLKALLDTQSVSKAAKQMHVTQSAMSRTLAQLREALNDPILVRQGNRIFLSEKAISLSEDVNKVVTEAATIFENQQFDPWTTEKNFTIASSYVVLDQLLPEVLHQFWKQAPNFNFELLQFSPLLNHKLEAGEVDLVLGYVGKPPASFSSELLTTDTICALVHEDHPCAGRDLTVEDLETYPVVRHSAWLGSPHFIRDHLDSLSDNIRIAAKTPSLPISLQMVKNTDKILITMKRAAQFNIYDDSMKIKELPGTSTPEFQYNIVWPEYWEHNRAHRWFREFIISRIRIKLDDFQPEMALVEMNVTEIG
ncbi:hypothetical protein ACH42_01150 [Endozoicomonas sp. (ex Bugula neritina AB1)]|nr:hypothetical protein ACH42_01150 [Endozoicomonas sp. (ex Bugula neritina AB1)]